MVRFVAWVGLAPNPILVTIHEDRYYFGHGAPCPAFEIRSEADLEWLLEWERRHLGYAVLEATP